jgi:hypothetical protein
MQTYTYKQLNPTLQKLGQEVLDKAIDIETYYKDLFNKHPKLFEQNEDLNAILIQSNKAVDEANKLIEQTQYTEYKVDVDIDRFSEYAKLIHKYRQEVLKAEDPHEE